MRESGAEAQAAEAEAAAAVAGRSCTSATTPRASPNTISYPALLGVILQMTMVMMTSMALTREAERGTMENLLCDARDTPMEIMLGKVLPYLVRGRGAGGRWCWWPRN